jgi:hypothetical protein
MEVIDYEGLQAVLDPDERFRSGPPARYSWRAMVDPTADRSDVGAAHATQRH